MKRFQSRAVSGLNQLISAANVSVFLTGTSTTAALYSGEGLTPLANPFKSDHLGVFEFYVESGDYDVNILDPVTGFARRFYDVSIQDVRDLAALKSGDSMQGQLRLQSGAQTIPGLGFRDDPDTGFFRPSADEIGFATKGLERVRLGSTSQVELRSGSTLQDTVYWDAPSTPRRLRIKDPGQNDQFVFASDATEEIFGNARVGVRVQSGGSTLKRRRLNFISGGNISLTVADDSANEEVDVTIDSVGGGGAPVGAQYIAMALDGTLTAERRLFSGDNIKITDQGANNDVILESLIAVRKQSATAAFRRKHLNIISGGNVSLTVADDAGNDEVDVTINAGGRRRTMVLVIPGDPATGTVVSIREIVPIAGEIKHIRSTVRAAPTLGSGDYRYDIQKNGTTIFTDQALRPLRSQPNGTGMVLHSGPSVTAFSAEDVFDADLDAKGLGILDIALHIEFDETLL